MTPSSDPPKAAEQKDALPSTESFLADFGIPTAATAAKEGTGTQVSRAQAKQELEQMGISKEFTDLITHYCAESHSAYELDQVNWTALAKRLGTQVEYLAEAAAKLNENGALWIAVLQVRIKKAHAAKIFRDNSWQRLESIAVNRLVELAEAKMIRDPGELLAVATQARRANEAQQKPSAGGSGGNTVNINFGGDPMDSENGLPAAGARMTLDLSPRVASALAKQRSGSESGSRVIDGQMLSAQELRNALESQKQGPADETTDEVFNEGDDR
jgi:hypothetical protein